MLSWTFLLRAPSECLPLRRRRAGEGLNSGDRLGGKAVFGPSEGKLTITLNRRKHMAGGSKRVRACICEHYAPGALELRAPQLFCPVCQLRPAAREFASSGDQVFPGWTGQSDVGASGLRTPKGVARGEPLGRLPLQGECSKGDPGSWSFAPPAPSLGPVALIRLLALRGLGT